MDILGFLGQFGTATPALLLKPKGSHRQCGRKWAWLCSSKTLFIKRKRDQICPTGHRLTIPSCLVDSWAELPFLFSFHSQWEIWTGLSTCRKENWKNLGREILQGVFGQREREHPAGDQHHELPAPPQAGPVRGCLRREGQHRHGPGDVSGLSRGGPGTGGLGAPPVPPLLSHPHPTPLL